MRTTATLHESVPSESRPIESLDKFLSFYHPEAKFFGHFRSGGRPGHIRLEKLQNDFNCWQQHTSSTELTMSRRALNLTASSFETVPVAGLNSVPLLSSKHGIVQ